MYKKILFLFISIFICTSPLHARELSYYIGLSGGESRTRIEDIGLDKDKSYTISAGLRFGPLLYPIKLEIEYLKLKSEKEFVMQTENEGIAFNSFVGIPLLPILEPYIGIGLVYMREKTRYDSFDTWNLSDWKYIPQYMIGIDVDLPTVSIAGGIEYRYIDSSFNFDGDTTDSKLHTFLLKLRFKF